MVPFNCSIVIGDALTWSGQAHSFVDELRTKIEALKELAPPLRWK